jgi:phosphohistidine swiveling domain-containing protein
MIRTEPRRCQDVDDLMGALIEERARNPLLGTSSLAVDSGTDGDPFTIDGIRGLCFTSRELEAYVEQAEEMRTELVEHHTGCVSVLAHVGEVDAERRAAKRAREELRLERLRRQRVERDFDGAMDELQKADAMIRRLRGAIESHRAVVSAGQSNRAIADADQALYAALETEETP